uniref:Cytochrome c oxidase subunit 3 n=1 Tax=Capsala katsuwoni TaxID=2904576 RepID=A0A8T9JD14_9PLAT|nr:cytochrome c oxidase subunit III [Capsala katsuwoni]UOK11870.1 cytochrome c oxidase subunit 3 [Capsala katsuwoni]
MTWLPIYNAFCVFFFLVSVIFWNLTGLLVFLILFGFSTFFLWLETKSLVVSHFVDGYWLFILSELIVFISLLTCCLWFYEDEACHLSNSDDIPLFGCFLLLSSSICVTAYHHEFGYGKKISLNLLLCIILGIGFVLLQLYEFSECETTILSTTYHASCFSTVGLHFTHVVIGLVLLTGCLLIKENVLGYYYGTTMVWYWHFVDYIWLLVYIVVYIC